MGHHKSMGTLEDFRRDTWISRQCSYKEQPAPCVSVSFWDGPPCVTARVKKPAYGHIDAPRRWWMAPSAQIHAHRSVSIKVAPGHCQPKDIKYAGTWRSNTARGWKVHGARPLRVGGLLWRRLARQGNRGRAYLNWPEDQNERLFVAQRVPWKKCKQHGMSTGMNFRSFDKNMQDQTPLTRQTHTGALNAIFGSNIPDMFYGQPHQLAPMFVQSTRRWEPSSAFLSICASGKKSREFWGTLMPRTETIKRSPRASIFLADPWPTMRCSAHVS